MGVCMYVCDPPSGACRGHQKRGGGSLVGYVMYPEGVCMYPGDGGGGTPSGACRGH